MIHGQINRIAYNQFLVLENFRFSFPASGFFILSGPSGCGKTTLLKAIAGTLEGADFKGSIKINNQIVEQGNYQATTFLSSMDFIDNLSLEQNLAIVSTDNVKIKLLLAKLQLTGLEQKKIYKLSTGQRQRAALIRALLSEAPILLLDEPCNALDQQLAELVIDILKEVARTKLVIISAHTYLDSAPLVEIKSNSKYLFAGVSKTDKVKSKNTNLKLVITKLLLNNFRLLAMLAVFNTLGIVFMMVGFIIGGGISNLEITGLHLARIKLAPAEIQTSQLQQVQELVDVVELPVLDQNLTIYDQSYDLISIVNNVVITPPILITNTPTLLINENFSTDLYFIDSNKLISVHSVLNVVYYSGTQTILVASNASLLITKLQKVTPLTVTYNYFTTQLVDINSAQISSNYAFTYIKDYYQLYSTSNFLAKVSIQQQIPDLVVLVEDECISIKNGGLVINDTKVQLTNQKGFGISKDYNLQIGDYFYFDINGNVIAKQVSYLIEDSRSVAIYYLDLAIFSSNQLADSWLLVYQYNQLGQVKSLTSDFIVESPVLVIESLLKQLSFWLQSAMSIFAAIFLFEGILVVYLLGKHLLLKHQKTYQLLRLLNYSKLEIRLVYLANFILIGLISIINGLIILGFFKYEMAQVNDNLLELDILGIKINLTMAKIFSINYHHVLQLIMLGLLVPLLSFAINAWTMQRQKK